MTVNYQDLGLRVRDARKAKHLTQEQLAEKVGISSSFKAGRQGNTIHHRKAAQQRRTVHNPDRGREQSSTLQNRTENMYITHVLIAVRM